MTAESRNFLLPYDTPLGVGQLRAHRPDPATLMIFVGPPPLRSQLLSIVPMAAMVGFFSIWLGALLWSVLIVDFLPLDKWLILPALITWGFCSFELTMQFRQWGRGSRFRLTADVFNFPYPSPRSRLEDLPAKQIVRLRVSTHHSRLSKRDVHALEVQLERGAHFQLLRGYPKPMLDEMCQILAAELEMQQQD